MIHIALTLSLFALCPPPMPAEPDLSSPEKAAEGFAKFWLGLQYQGNPFRDAMLKAETVGKECFTDKARDKLEKKAKQSREFMEANKTLEWSLKTQGITDNADGTKAVDVRVTRTRNKKNWKTKAVEKVTEDLLHRFVMEKVGDKWMVKELYRPCFMCQGKGVCGSCKGAGQMGGRDCFSCKGGKTCKSCQGKKVRKENMKMDMDLTKTSVAFKPDLSSAAAAAKTYLSLTKHKEQVLTDTMRKVVEEVLANAKKYFTPALMKTIEASMEQAKAKGKKRRAAKNAAKVESVEEEGDTAHAVISEPSSFGKGTARKKRLVLKKSGDKWLVDAVQSQCWGCKGVGKCRNCKGTGVMEQSGNKCWGCKGEGKCRTCKGSGWYESRF